MNGILRGLSGGARAPLWTAAALIAAVCVALGGPARAQDRIDVQFEPGRSGATLNGAVIGDEYLDYVLRARAGQRMRATLTVTGTNGNGSAMFNILPAGKDYPAYYNGSTDDDKSADIELPENGEYAIRVYLMGNDRDAGKTVGFTLDVEIGGGGGRGAMAGAPGAGEQICLRDVTAMTNNPDVTLLDSRPAASGLEVIVGVGPQRAPWRCVAYGDGSTGEIMSLADEGAM